MKDNDDKGVPCPFCKGKNAKRCTHCKGKGTFQIEFASTESVEYLSTFIDMVMEQIYRIAGIGNAWVSDESSVWDFIETDADIAALGKALGVPVDGRDTIVEVAKRVRDA